MQDFPGLRRNFVDTEVNFKGATTKRFKKNVPSNADDEIDFRLGRNVEITRGSGDTLQANFLSFFCQIIFYIRFGTLEDDLSLRFCDLSTGINNSVPTGDQARTKKSKK